MGHNMCESPVSYVDRLNCAPQASLFYLHIVIRWCQHSQSSVSQTVTHLFIISCELRFSWLP